MMKYNTHKEIPKKFEKIILKTTNEKSLSAIDIWLCNQIIEEDERHEEETKNLKNFEVKYRSSKDEKVKIVNFKGIEPARVLCDRLIGFDEKRLDVTITLKQNGRLFWTYIKGKVYE